jgi:hypothetical protein
MKTRLQIVYLKAEALGGAGQFSVALAVTPPELRRLSHPKTLVGEAAGLVKKHLA